MSGSKTQEQTHAEPSAPPDTSQASPAEDFGSNQVNASEVNGFEFTEEEASVIEQQALLDEQLAAEVALTLDGWRVALPYLLSAVGSQAQAARRGVSSADMGAVVAARDTVFAALDSLAQLAQSIGPQISQLQSRGADVRPIHAWLQGFAPEVISALSEQELGRPFFLSEYQGVAMSDQVAGMLGCPEVSGDAARDVEVWKQWIDHAVDYLEPILTKAEEAREWATSLPPAEDAGLAGLALLRDNPVSDSSGREREYLDAVVRAHAPEGWNETLNMDRSRLEDQIQLEDELCRAGAGEAADDEGRDLPSFLHDDYGENLDPSVDFDALDGGLGDIRSQARDVHMDDDVVMDALGEASSPEERDYMLRRLRHSETEDDDYQNLYHEVTNRLGGDEADEFEGYRAEAGVFSGAVGEKTEGYSGGEAFLDAAQALPGAYAAHTAGTVFSIPIAGDFLENELGADTRDLVNGIHDGMGVSEDVAAMSTEMAIGSGKATGAVGAAAAGGGGWSALKGWGALSTAGKTMGAGGMLVGGADTANNGYQALTGEKMTGEEISGLEQGAAGLGMLGGLADGVSAVKGYQAARAATAADKLTALRSGASVDDVGGFSLKEWKLAGRGLHNPDAGKGLAEAMDTTSSIAGYSSQAAKTTDAGMKMYDAQYALESASDEEVVSKAEAWLDKSGDHPLAVEIQVALDAGEVDRVRDLVEEAGIEAEIAGTTEHTFGAAATIAAGFAGH